MVHHVPYGLDAAAHLFMTHATAGPDGQGQAVGCGMERASKSDWYFTISALLMKAVPHEHAAVQMLPAKTPTQSAAVVQLWS